MTKKEKSEFKDILLSEFRKLYPEYINSPITEITLYVAWLEERLIEAYNAWLKNKLSKPTATQGVDKIDGDGC